MSNAKRKQSDATGSASKKASLSQSDHGTNALFEVETNTSPEITVTLQGTQTRALSELIANAYDAAIATRKATKEAHGRPGMDDVTDDVTITVQYKVDNNDGSDSEPTWRDAEIGGHEEADVSAATEMVVKIVNKCGEKPLELRHFVYDPQGKDNCVESTGKFGYGLNDAAAMLHYFDLGYEAETFSNYFEMKKALHSDKKTVVIARKPESHAAGQVTQKIIWKKISAGRTSADDLLTAVNKACGDSWGWLVQNAFLDILSKSEETLHAKGTMATWTSKARASKLFDLIPKQSVYVHGRRYSLAKSLPVFVYNLNMDKKHLSERDRQRAPTCWPNKAVTVFRCTVETWDDNES